jgi:hypothetical protein
MYGEMGGKKDDAVATYHNFAYFIMNFISFDLDKTPIVSSRSKTATFRIFTSS